MASIRMIDEVAEAISRIKALFDAAPWLPEHHPHAGYSKIAGCCDVTYRDLEVLAHAVPALQESIHSLEKTLNDQ